MKSLTLQELFDNLTEHEKQLIKGILPPHSTTEELLSLNERDFRQKLQDSLSLEEIGKLSAAEVEFRGELMDKVVDAWSFSTNNNNTAKENVPKRIIILKLKMKIVKIIMVMAVTTIIIIRKR